MLRALIFPANVKKATTVKTTTATSSSDPKINAKLSSAAVGKKKEIVTDQDEISLLEMFGELPDMDIKSSPNDDYEALNNMLHNINLKWHTFSMKQLESLHKYLEFKEGQHKASPEEGCAIMISLWIQKLEKEMKKSKSSTNAAKFVTPGSDVEPAVEQAKKISLQEYRARPTANPFSLGKGKDQASSSSSKSTDISGKRVLEEGESSQPIRKKKGKTQKSSSSQQSVRESPRRQKLDTDEEPNPQSKQSKKAKRQAGSPPG
jgi:hypothetical protein